MVLAVSNDRMLVVLTAEVEVGASQYEVCLMLNSCGGELSLPLMGVVVVDVKMTLLADSASSRACHLVLTPVVYDASHFRAWKETSVVTALWETSP